MSKPITMKLHLPDKNEDEEEKDYYTTVGEVYEYQSDSGMDANKFGQWAIKQMMLLPFEERIGIKLYFDPEIDAISLVRKASAEEINEYNTSAEKWKKENLKSFHCTPNQTKP